MNDKSDIVELAVIMKTGVCPFIVVFYGCLVRDVSVTQLNKCSVKLCSVFTVLRVNINMKVQKGSSP